MSGELFMTFLKAKPFNLSNLLYYGIFANSGYPEVGNVFGLLFVSYPLSKFFTFPAFHNVKCILYLIFNAWAAYFVISRLTKNYGAAVVCGIFMLFNPHTMMMLNISRLRAGILGFMILFVYYFYKFCRKPNWRDAVLSGIFLAVSSLFYWFHGIFLVWTALFMIAGKIFVIWRDYKKRENAGGTPAIPGGGDGKLAIPGNAGKKSAMPGAANFFEFFKKDILPFLIKTSVVFFILAVVFVPFYLPYMKETVSMRMDDVKFFIKFPPLAEGLKHHRDFLNKDGFPWLAVRLILSDSTPLVFHFSFLFMIVGLFAFKGKKKLAFFMLFIFIFFSLLSYGPFLKVTQKKDLGEFAMIKGKPVPMPYKFFFEYIPPTARLQHPNRFLAMSAIALMFLGGMGLSVVFNLLKKTDVLKYAVFLLVIPGMLVYYPSRTPSLYMPSVSNIDTPEFYKNLGQDKEMYGIIEFPWQRNLDRISFYQMFHGKKSPGTLSVNLFNNLRELPDGKLKHLSSFNPEFDQSNFKRYVEESSQGKDSEITREDLKVISRMGYRYIILHEWDFPFEGEEIDLDPLKHKKSYLKVKSRLEKLLGKPEKHWEVRYNFVLQDIPVATRMEPFEMTVFDLGKL